MNKVLFFGLALLSSCTSYKYQHEWYAIYKDNDQLKILNTGPSNSLVKIPKTSCLLSPAIKKNDSSERIVACSNDKSQIKMSCMFAGNSISEDIAECEKEVGEVKIIARIIRSKIADEVPANKHLSSPKIYKESDAYTYDNVWSVISNQNESNTNFRTQSEHLVKVSGVDCALGPTTHTLNDTEDKFSRKIACFGAKEFQEVFECKFDKGYVNDDGDKDEVRTRCSKRFGDIIVAMTIVKYPKGKDWNKSQMRSEIEDTKTY